MHLSKYKKCNKVNRSIMLFVAKLQGSKSLNKLACVAFFSQKHQYFILQEILLAIKGEPKMAGTFCNSPPRIKAS